jgi:hypothetical protein
MPGGAWHLLCLRVLRKVRFGFCTVVSDRGLTKELEVTSRLVSRCLLSVITVLFLANVALAAKPSDSLLPATTKGYLSIASMKQLSEQFDRSTFGQLANDPAMKPFVEDIKHQVRQQGLRQLEQLGLTWDELDGLPTGEVALAMIQVPGDDGAIALVADVTGHGPQAQAQLAKIADRLVKSGAKRLRRSATDQVIVFQLVGEPGRKPPLAAYILTNDLLIASDSIAVVDAITQALAGQRSDVLATLPAYRAIMSRCEASAGNLPPNLRWFVEPFGYAETLRAATPLREKHKGPDLVKVFKSQGFTAIQGVGGFVNFSAGTYEILHRTVVYAPPVAGHGPQDKYTLAARMLRFPAGGDLMPPSWVPSDVATCTTFNCDIQNAFSVIDTLVDEMVGDKVFHNMINSLRDDPDGPRVDIAKDIVGHLRSQVTIISDCAQPIGPKSERKVLSVPVDNEAVVADAIRKLMETEKDARRREIDNHVIWEMVDSESEVPTLEIETPGLPTRKPEPSSTHHTDRNERFFATSVVCVANGRLFLSSHMDMLQRVLADNNKPADQLGSADDFRLVAAQAQALGLGPLSFRIFSRVDQEFLPTYELVRTGQMPRSETLLAKLMNSVASDGKDAPPRKQRIDGHDLPEFPAVQRYLGPGGTFVTSLDDGWMLTGLMMAREHVVATGPGDGSLKKIDTQPVKAETSTSLIDVGQLNAESSAAPR